ncbi:ABC transporter ATP-binding protein [Streptomyces scabiei]|uniref:ABC transporter ATP-binding protein n=1 Tax=Streptomyces scabiei TaxID=1930 RepID=UPI0004E772B6|nr:ATP-binding cassette domain-containing protein [Streptomyces scabiei]KFG06711.1 peptide ABC transporter ATPase [Streptomyces scabiei]MDX2536094.1 ATP-binding cassette domain-containing protein [Streptomyces scabiei]MDX2797163.1 ATP-binding cassette domain-containing protein [Streptomyces scabiei]MDX2832097.1 ATP-binding cassette domain-containing protein [Streptomyces scabiei]MDX2855838.1 ATP-binding cassette domain-containing protein [Streptomyces scabiei]
MTRYDDEAGRAAPAPLAEITGLRVEVGGRAIVDGVDLRVLPGRITALVGASGSGKTTTGLALLGEYPEGARVTGEVRLATAGPVGYVPQHPAAVLNPARRISALLTDIARAQVRPLPRRARRTAARDRVLRALAQAQLSDGEALLARHPHQLSGGQQQRVVLAQALLLGARVVVADEPTTGQDTLTKRGVVEQLAAVAAHGIAVVLLSHDLDVVRALADEVHVMREGRVVESGPTARVWEAPRHAWTRQLLSARPSLPETGPTPRTDQGTGPGEGTPARVARTATAPVLRVRGLTARHRDGSRGTGVTVHVGELALYAGESLAVVGRSGSGKTTLARCLAGLHRDLDGEILLDGIPLPRSLRDRDRGRLAAVQYVFQDARASFDEHRPVRDQIARTAVRLRGLDAGAAEAEALTTARRLGLPAELVRRRPAGLSGGELQRAALARALLARPRVLLCDEITSGLDAVTRRGILDVLTGLCGDAEGAGPALVLITHDLDTAAVAHRIAVMDAGHVVEQGPAHQVLTAPRHAFTAHLVSAARRPAGAAP